MKRNAGFLFFGIVFGFALSRVGASEYNLIYRMFTGEDLTLAFVMAGAIAVGAVGMKVLALLGNKTFRGEPIKVSKKPLNRNNAIGGMLFGMGWGIAGACPGTVLAQLGEGKILALFTFLGLMLGTYVYAFLAERKIVS